MSANDADPLTEPAEQRPGNAGKEHRGEVLSPSSARADRFTKRRLYQEVGIPAYWIVDADDQVVEVWTPGATFPVFERERLVWHPEGAREALVIPCRELFTSAGAS